MKIPIFGMQTLNNQDVTVARPQTRYAIQYSDIPVLLIMTIDSIWDTIPIAEAEKRLSST
jgi:hypothetical protein